MPRLQIELDAATNEALTSLAGARGTTPADLVAKIVEQYVQLPSRVPIPDPLDALVGSIDADPDDVSRTPRRVVEESVKKYQYNPNVQRVAPPDPLDAMVGSIDAEPVGDIDEVIYGR